MKENKKRKYNRKQDRKKITIIHVIIAVVALLECFALMSFTTYSWIESSSSLIIMNGPKSTATTTSSSEIVNMDIVKQRQYRANLTEDTVADADLNLFYSKVAFFNLAKASSNNGMDFYFPKDNAANTGKSLNSFRSGDTTDFNTGYLYFDFDIYNNLRKYDYFFNNTDIFSAVNTDDSKDENGNNYFDTDDLAAIRKAMRISIQQNAEAPLVFAETADGYKPANSTNSVTSSNYIPKTITAYTTQSQGGGNQKIFTSTVTSNGNTKVSIRIWFECRDTGFMSRSNDWSDAKKRALTGVQLGINLNLVNSANTFSDLLFDDYTFSTYQYNLGGHVSDDYYTSEDYDDYRMFFVYTSQQNGVQYRKMQRVDDNTNPNATRWTTVSDAGISETDMENLKGNTTSYNYSQAYFAFGSFPDSASTPTSTLLKWKLTSAPSAANGNYLYNALSTVKFSSANNYTPECLGGWYDSLMSGIPSGSAPITLVKFKDMATGYTNSVYNSGSNFKYITASATASSTIHDVIYLNTQNSYANTNAQASVTSSLFYDSSEQIYKGYIPTLWLADSANYNLYFRYCPSGYYNSPSLTWESTVASAQGVDYIYTALGYSDAKLITTATATNEFTGQGTWLPVSNTPVSFSTELIDSSTSSGQRYKVFANVGGNDRSYLQYPMIPDSSHTVFSAYVPTIDTPIQADINFTRYSDYSSTTPDAYWYGDVRCSDTYYPVTVNSVSNDTVNDSVRYERGYWNVSVLIDGTWEHLIYDTITNSTISPGDPDPVSATGTLQYSTDGTNYYNLNVAPYVLDNYRWYVPGTTNGSSRSTIWYKWVPYSGTEFIYEHRLSDGIYCIITE